MSSPKLDKVVWWCACENHKVVGEPKKSKWFGGESMKTTRFVGEPEKSIG